jgi:hypothetical protein
MVRSESSNILWRKAIGADGMSTLRSRGRLGAVAGIALAASLALSGCLGTSPPGDGVYSAPTETAGSGDEPAPSSTELPAGFPEDFPLIEGDIIVAYDLGTGWAVWIQSDDPTVDFETASGLLVSGGYTNEVSTTDASGSYGSFAKTPLQVQLTAGDDAQYGTAVAYTIYRTE